ARHPVIAFGIVGRDVAFVAKKEIDLVPRQRSLRGKQAIKAFWSRASGERNREAAFRGNGRVRLAHEFVGGCLKQGGTIRKNANIRRGVHGFQRGGVPFATA